MDTEDLNRIFQLTALATIAVTAVGFWINLDWAIAYGTLAVLALVNWWALGQTLSGYTRKNPLQLIAGLMLKPLLLTTLIIYAMKVGIEVTSFLAALNTFFVCLFIYMIGKAIRSGRGRDGKAPIPTGSNEAHA